MAESPLAYFLKYRKLLDRFRDEIAPHIVYLRSVLGDGFFAEPKGDVPFASPEAAPWQESIAINNELNFHIHNEGQMEWTQNVWDDHETEREKAEIAAKNFDLLKSHLMEIEARLLGSWGHTPHMQSNPGLAPFASLLSGKRVSVGKQGAAGGYSGTLKQYSAPTSGKEYSFSKEEFDKTLVELASPGVHPSESHIVLVGENLKNAAYGMPSAMPVEKLETGGEPIFRYNGIPGSSVQPRILHSHQMPSNAIYVVNPKKVALLASPLCKVRTDRSGMRIVDVWSNIHHSLIHVFDENRGRELEKHHAAFLSMCDGEPSTNDA